MANVPFNALYDQVLPYLPGAENGIVDSQIRKVLREFMKRTTLYRETFQFDTVAGVSMYKLTPTFGQVCSIIEAWKYGDKPLFPKTEGERPPIAQGEPNGWFTTIPEFFNLYPQPGAIYPITVNAVIQLSQTDTTFPEELAHHYGEAIAAGVMAAMYAMPGKPWTQNKAALDAGRMFNGTIRTIRGKLRDGGQPNQSTFTAAAPFGV